MYLNNYNSYFIIMDNKIVTFTDLNTWKESHKLVLLVYKVTKNFPDTEKYGLISQMKRSSISITANIAEGFGRNTYAQKLNFYNIAKGSLTELHDQLIVA